MTKYTVAQARTKIANVLDTAERGEPVVIERRGLRFEVRLAPTKRVERKPKPLFTHVDTELDEGLWTWESPSGSATPGQLKFRKRRK